MLFYSGKLLIWILLSACHSDSILHWKRGRKKSVWMKVPIAQSYLIPVAFNHGFSYHHAVGDYAMLLKWLPGRQSKVPPYATHQIGVSGNCNKYCIFIEALSLIMALARCLSIQ